ncbi:MAG TPA: DsbA family protein [Caulobacterales bacterium]|nr:DsbA family protein [Caulobacterales bacterium]
MIGFLRGLVLTLAVAACAPPAPPATSAPAAAASAASVEPPKGPLNLEQDAQVRAIVRDYLLKNPELLTEMQAALEAKKTAEAHARLALLMPKIERDPRRFSVGPVNGKVTVVEFFDYRCPYCKVAFDWTQANMKANRDVRFVFVEFPILGPNSLEASKAAVASMKQGRYLPFHDAMMRAKGDLNSGQIDQIAKSSGVDVVRMRRDMNDPAIMALLQEDQDIAAQGQINATPTFLINGQLFSGFQPEEMDKSLRALRTRR